MELKSRSFTSKEPHVAREPQVADPWSRLQEMNLLAPGIAFAWYRDREEDYIPLFAEDDELTCIVRIYMV